MHIFFHKFQATGNDFILLDNRDGRYSGLRKEQIAALCDRRFGIGSDGLMLLNSKEGYDFEMKYFNSDGASGSMCGNGGRCIAAFARQCGIGNDELFFVAFDGDHIARISGGEVSIGMNAVSEISRDGDAFVIDTGSPHYVLPVEDAGSMDVFVEGRKVRYAPMYEKKGINVNFVEQADACKLIVRTYERGVEDETYSCGTGVTASAIAFAGIDDGSYRFKIETRGGSLEVRYNKQGGLFDDIWLTGPATFVFSGDINI